MKREPADEGVHPVIALGIGIALLVAVALALLYANGLI